MKTAERLNRTHSKLRHDLICEINKRLKKLFPESGYYDIEEFQLVLSTGDGNLDVISIEIDWEFLHPIDLRFIDCEFSIEEIGVSDLLAFYGLICQSDFKAEKQ